VRQTAAGANVGVVGPDVSAVAAALAVSLARYGLSNPELSISIVERDPRHASTGKLKRFIALRASSRGLNR
jgi:phenylacetate-CoA ligase